MASESTYTRLLALYLKGNMPLKEQEMLFESVVREMETRSYGNYPKFRRMHWPRIRETEFRFYSVDDFVSFHLPFAEKFVGAQSIFCFEGPEDEVEMFGKHEDCMMGVDGKRRGCDICELLVSLDAHLPDEHPAKPLAQPIEREMEVRVTIAGAVFDIRGTVRDGVVRSLVVEGYMHLLDWGLYPCSPEHALSKVPEIHQEDLASVEGHDSGRIEALDKPDDQEVQLIRLHDLNRPGFQHRQDAAGCWEVSVTA
ncbi:hypothetical protein LTR85_001196 [Meristemomyces frigidus]|nr:hypothetical protein LTR85_001196 [Meristemomyces frigidus]